jgi:hypothetical protein
MDTEETHFNFDMLVHSGKEQDSYWEQKLRKRCNYWNMNEVVKLENEISKSCQKKFVTSTIW